MSRAKYPDNERQEGKYRGLQGRERGRGGTAGKDLRLGANAREGTYENATMQG